MSDKIAIQDIIDLLAEKHGMTKKDAETFVKGMFELIEEALATEKYVKVKGLGTFKLTEVESRASVNVNTGERIEIQGHTKISFTPDSTMKDLINKPFAHFETVILNKDTQLEDTETEIEGEGEKEENVDVTVSGNTEEAIITEEIVKTDDNEMNAPQEQGEEIPVTADVASEPVTEEPMTSIEKIQIVELEAVQEETAEIPAATIADEEKETSVIIESIAEVSVEETIADETAEETMPETVLQKEEEIMTIADAAMLAAHERKTLSEALASQEMVAETEPEIQVNQQPEGETETEKIEITEPPTEAGEPQVNEKEDRKAKTLWRIIIAIILILCIAGGIYWYLQTEDNALSSQVPHAMSVSQKETAETTLLQDTASQKTDTVKASTIDTTEGGSVTTVTSPQPQQSVVTATSKEAAKVTLADTVEYDITGTKTNYTLQEGESLIKVAMKFYGTKKLWPYIVKHNKSVIKDADRVPIGTILRIPELAPKKQ